MPALHLRIATSPLACAIVFAAVTCATCTPARADPASAWTVTETPAGVGSHEIWFGADAGARNWLVYSGGTYAPWDDIHGEGWRLRATAAYGRYTYHFDAKTRVAVEKSTSDALLGYQARFGDLTAKAFVGWSLLSNDYEIPSRSLRLAEQKTGFKTALELWLNLGTDAWTSLDLAYAEPRSTASARSRLGYRVLPTVSVGVEGVFNQSSLAGQVQVNEATTSRGNARIGGFARYEWFGGEVSASGGWAGDIVETRASGDIDLLHQPALYGTFNLIFQY